jgi:hypothetical protein
MEPTGFSESEASRLLRRAAQLQANDDTAVKVNRADLSFEDIEAAAREAGIDPKYLHQALAEPVEQKKRGLFGGLFYEREKTFPIALNNDDIADVAFQMKQVGKFVPMPTAVPSSMVGQVTKGFAYLNIDLSTRRGTTHLKTRHTPFLSYFAGLHTPLILAPILLITGLAEKNTTIAAIGVAVLALGVGLFAWFSELGKQKAAEITAALFRALEDVAAKKASEVPQHAVQASEEDEHLRLGEGT